ncbi:MAG: S-layer homology domain-containing protein [Candidatus Sericytochromatia bacterium]|nr:S-layer homology domain-containing protein [Candidatus Sericytochromatia bacterium]
MAYRHFALILVLAACFAHPAPAWAQGQEPSGSASQKETGETPPNAIRADLIRSFPDTMIADLPSGHWATHATQVAVANGVLPLEEGEFRGDRQIVFAELHQALAALVVTAENVAAKGMIPELRAAVEAVPQVEQPVNRIQVAEATSRFLDAANQHGLIALAEPGMTAPLFKDLAPSVPPSVTSLVDTYKVMTGYKDMTFRPQEIVTRYQLAAIATQILDDMRRAPLAQRPIEAPPTVVVVPEPVVPEPVEKRPSFRANAPVALTWQALNYGSVLSTTPTLSVIPVSGMLTGYAGPLMLQGVGNFRYDIFGNNGFDSELRLGYGDLKWGGLQLIPYIGANLGLGASLPGQSPLATYVGGSYGGIVSALPMDNVEIWGNLGQSTLLAGGRWGQNFQSLGALSTSGTLLTNYGFGVDYYVTPNMALTFGMNNFQLPADLQVAQTGLSGTTLDTLGGNVGLAFGF